MDIDVEGTPFSVLMERAVKLKSLRMGEERKKYDEMPRFYQNSIYPHEDVVSARNLAEFQDRLAAANDMKAAGNTAYREGRWSDALFQYEKALSVFRYLQNTNPSWKNEGIKDKDIAEISYVCEQESDAKELTLFLGHCYNNVSLACFRMKEFNLAVNACDFALAVNSECDKSYFLRAQSRLTPLNCGALEQEAALIDLRKAIEINPMNNEARKLLRDTKAKAKSQKLRNKEFSGLFDRGEVYNTKELADAKDLQRKSKDMKRDAANERDVVLGRQLIHHYEANGMESEKEKLEQSLNAEMKRRNKGSVDFRNPSAEMIKDAESMGVDLSDPQTIELLQHLQSGGDISAINAEENTTPSHKVKEANYFRIFSFVVLMFFWTIFHKYNK